MTLLNFLTNLNSAYNNQSVYVNPENINEYRIGQNCFENGGLLDNWIFIGTLDRLSFGFQSMMEAISVYIDAGDDLNYNGKKVMVNKKGIIEAFQQGNLDRNFQAFLESEATDIMSVWSENEAEFFIFEELPLILANAESTEE